MLAISKQTDYALQLIASLSALMDGNMLSMRKFSKESNISFLFLQKIAKKLREAGIIKAEKGSRGGYTLTKPANQIQVSEVIEAVEGPVTVAKCAKIGRICDKAGKCPLRRGVKMINSLIFSSLSQTTIADIV